MARAKTKTIAGMEPESIPDVDQAAENYDDAKTKRVKATKKETETKQYLLEKMIEHKLERHVTPGGLLIVVTGKKNVTTEWVEEKQQEEGDGKE